VEGIEQGRKSRLEVVVVEQEEAEERRADAVADGMAKERIAVFDGDVGVGGGEPIAVPSEEPLPTTMSWWGRSLLREEGFK
jgi:hypothetical protein